MKKKLSPKDISLEDHKGVPNFKGSGYNGKGNVDNSKVRSNKGRRGKKDS